MIRITVVDPLEKSACSFNTCGNCGTLNYFDQEITDLYGHVKCYHCGSLVEVPDVDYDRALREFEIYNTIEELKYDERLVRQGCYRRMFWGG